MDKIWGGVVYCIENRAIGALTSWVVSVCSNAEYGV